MRRATEFAEGVSYLTTLLSNLYFIDNEDGSWVLLDCGMPGFAAAIKSAAEQRYGHGRPPQCIVLSHGHFDHVGSANALAQHWDVPIYAHRLEMPYVTGLSSYPPADAVASDGSLGFVYRLFPRRPYDLTPHLQVMPEDDSVPGLAGWKAIHTPGHTPGHVAYFREQDRVLIAADALSTAAQDSPTKLLFSRRNFERPPVPFTTDWVAAKTSVQKLAELDPETVAAGHGLPLSGRDIPMRIRKFAAEFTAPKKGRYVNQPVVADETGVLYVPPPVPDIGPAVAGGAAVLVGVASVLWLRNRSKRSPDVRDLAA
jgi:glyoxylase-like metal-dependent hydrolase (beta-lactamase superfamily II)